MGKLLRILVIIFLVISVAALVLGVILFGKRELLKGRTQKLANALVAVGTAIEAEPAVLEEKPEYPARDISPCTSEILVSPELSDFWEKYSPDLEVQDQPTLDIKRRKVELMTYYKVDPITGKIVRDSVTGQKIIEGKGTMQAVLADFLTKAEEQYTRLNATRQQLVNLRTELVDIIEEQNKNKANLRSALKEIMDLKTEIERLKGEIELQKQKIQELEEEKQSLEEQIAEQKDQIAQLEEKNTTLENDNKLLTEKNDELRKGSVSLRPSGVTPSVAVHIEPGEKGKVVAVNEEWDFVILELSDDFLREILGEEMSRPLPTVELFIKRDQEIVTKVRLIQVKAQQKLGIGDNLTDWQQMPIKVGDLVFR